MSPSSDHLYELPQTVCQLGQYLYTLYGNPFDPVAEPALAFLRISIISLIVGSAYWRLNSVWLHVVTAKVNTFLWITVGLF